MYLQPVAALLLTEPGPCVGALWGTDMWEGDCLALGSFLCIWEAAGTHLKPAGLYPDLRVLTSLKKNYLTVSGLNYSMQISSLTRDGTRGPCFGSMTS